MVQRDPFDEPIDNTESPRSPGRPRTREIRERGNVGRPRIRPIDDPSSRRRGRPQVDPSSIADQISREAVISGQITAKAINASVQGLQGTIQQFQKAVINPLSKSVTAFSQSISKFNATHQVYLREQVALAKDVHETFKLFRRTGIDPILRTAALSQKGVNAVTQVMRDINREKYQGKDYEQMISSMSSIDKKLNRFVTAGVVGTEATETFLKEYYKSSKGTSRFLNAVTFATEDIAEDINSLKSDLYKYFRGKSSSKSILQDQTEQLRKIENNTKGMGFLVASSVLSGISALVKTAFTFNKYGTTDLFTNLFGKNRGISAKGTSGFGGKALSKIMKSKPAQAMKTFYQEASLGGQGDFAKGIAESFEKTGRSITSSIGNLKGLGKSIADAWDHSKIKQFWAVGWRIFRDRWDRAGAIGVTQVDKVRRAYARKNYKGPHPTSSSTFGSNTEALKAVQRLATKIERSSGEYGPLGDWDSDNYAQVAFTPEQMRTLKPIYNTTRKTTAKSNVVRANFGSKKASNVIQATFGAGPQQVTANPESNTKITNGDTSTPRRAWGSLLKLQIRIHGLLQKMFKHIKHVDENTDELEEGVFDKAKEGLFGGSGGGLLAGAGAAFAGTKLGKFLKAGKAGWKGAALAGGALGAAKLAKNAQAAAQVANATKAMKAGSTARVLWDTFGWGSAAVKKGGTGMQALANFKKTGLGASKLGRAIRIARIASAGWGTGAESRILGGLIHATKWGGAADPLGATVGLFNAAKNRKSIAGFAKMANAGKVNPGLLAKVGLKMDAAGAGIVKGAKAAGGVVNKGLTGIGNWLGNVGKVGNVGKIAGLSKAGGLLGGLGTAAKAIFKKVPIIGGLFTIGLGLKELIKDKDWKSGLWHIFTGTLMAIPATAVAGTILSVGGDIAKFASNKLKEKNANKVPNAEAAGAAAVEGVGSDPTISKEVTKVAGVSPYGKNGPAKSSIGISNTEDHYKDSVVINPKATPSGTQKKPANAAKQPNTGGGYGAFGTAAKAAKGAIKGAAKAVNQASSGTPVVGAAAGKAENSPYINWNGQNHSHLLPEFSSKLASAAEKFYRKTGKKITITSGVRTNQKQAELYARRHGAGDTSISNNVARPVASTTVNWRGTQYWVKGKDNGQNMRTGHTVGGAVDVANWGEFKPYAIAEGLTWGGSFDPTDKMHFQVNTKAPVIGSASPVKTPPPGAVKVGDMNTSAGPSRETSPTIIPATSPTANNSPGTSPEANTEISPIIQDYGLAIINNLLFS